MACSPLKFERQNSEGSAESLKTLNKDLRNHLAKLRSQVDFQKGSIKQAHWQRVLNVRSVREIEQEKCNRALERLRCRMNAERYRELENMKACLQIKHESEVIKTSRQKDVETAKLKQELNVKERMLRKLLRENRRGSLNFNIFAKRNKLVNELSDLRNTKKELEESLEYASEAERHHSLSLKRSSEGWESELQKVRREAHIEIKQLIEQLRNKDKIISHLEKELGQTAGYAVSLQLDQNHQNKMSAATASSSSDRQLSFSSPLKHRNTLKSFTIDTSLCEKNREECMELETESNQSDDSIIDQQAVKKCKYLEERHKSLKERNRKFLEKNVELTSENRTLKDQISSFADDNEKLKEQAEHSKRKTIVYARQLSQEKLKLVNLEIQLTELEKLKEELTEQTKIITSLRQSCSEKDRRMELIQHHKKRRRLRRSQEKCCGVKETFYGYDEDDRSLDSENSLSLSSASHGTMSDDELWDELSREEREKSYQKLMKEHLQLEKSQAMLMKQTDNYTDPQRNKKLRCDLEHNLILSQGRIEELEQILQSTGKEDICDLLREKDRLVDVNEQLERKLRELLSCRSQLEEELKEAKDQIDDMEFQILEFQESVDETPKISSSGEVTQDEASEALLKEKLVLSVQAERLARMEIEELRRELATVLEGRGREVDVILQKLDTLKNAEQQIEELEVTARELQAKVISLQQEKTALEDKLNQRKTTPTREPVMNIDAPDLNEMEMLSLKDQISAHEISELELMEKNIELQERLAEFEINHQNQTKQIADLETTLKTCKKNLTASQKSPKSPSKRPDVDQNFQTVTKEIEKLVEKAAEPMSVKMRTKSLGNQANVLVQPNSSDEVKSLEKQLQKMHEENLKLKQKLERKLLDYDSDKSSDDDRESKINDLESVCEELKERSYGAELSERQIKEKLKLAEQTINDLEASETHFRERSEELKNRDNEAKKQVQELHYIVEEMKDIIQEKDIFELALREKVQFLEKVEAASNQQITELQSSEKYLQDQLDTLEKLQTDPDIVFKLKRQIEGLSSENQRLASRVTELEEDEEILRDNWRKVAAEDAKRALNQQEKVQLLELLNRELKSKLHDSQEAAAINLLNNSSIAMELSESQGILDVSEHSNEVSDLKIKIRHLEDELLEVTEIKNNKIELLQERIEKFYENEIKLSETVMEFEVAESELKSKLAFYESSKVTVEKILDYEDKLHELRSSQEDLLEQLHSLEDHEEDLQEKLDRTEKEYKGKISRLETEISNHKEREKLSTIKIRSLEKHEEELMEKVTKFAICEKRFHDKFENQESQISELKHQIEDKKEKIRELDITKSEMFNQISKLMENEKQLHEKISELEQSVSDYKLSADSKSGSVENLKQDYQGHIEEMAIKVKSQSQKILQLQESLSLDTESKDDRIEELEKENKELVQQLEAYQSESHDRMEQSEHLSLDIESKEERIEELEKENMELIEKLESHISEENAESKPQRFEELARENQELVQELKIYKSENTESKAHRIKELENQNKIVQQLENHKSESHERIEQLEKMVSDAEERENEFSEKAMLADKQVSDMHSDILESESQVEELITSEQKLNEKVEYLEETVIGALNVQVTDLKQTIYELNNKNNGKDVTQELQSLQKQLDTEVTNNKSLSESKSELERDLKQVRYHSEQIKQKLINLEIKNEDLVKLRTEMEAKLGSERLEVIQLRKKIEILVDAETRLMNRVDDLEESECRLSSEVTDLKSKPNLEIQAELHSIEKEQVSSLQSVNSIKQGSIGANSNSTESDIMGSVKLSSLFQRVQVLEAEKEELSLKLAEATSTDYTLKQMKDKTRLLEESEDRLMDRIMELEESEERLKKELSRTNEDLDIDSFRSKESDLKKSLGKLKHEKGSLENELQLVADQLSEEKERSEKLRQKVKSLEKSALENSKTFQRLDQSSLQLKSKLTNTEDKLQEEKSKCHHFSAKVNSLLQDLDVMDDRMRQEREQDIILESSLQNEISEVKIEKLSLESQLQEMVAKVREERADTEAKLREQKLNFDNLQNSKNQLDEELVDIKQNAKQLQRDLTASQKKMEDTLSDYESKMTDMESKENDLREKVKDKTRLELDLKKKIHNLEKLIKQNQTDSDELDHKCSNLEKDYKTSLTINCVLKERIKVLEVDLARLISVEEDYSCIKTHQSESNTEMEILKETLSDFNILKFEHETNLTEKADLKSKIANLESSLSNFQNLQDDHNKLITGHRENKYQCEILEKRSVEFDDLKQTHKKLQVIHEDSERKLKHVKEMLVEFENLKQKHSEIVQINKNLENQLVEMIKPGDHKEALQKLNLSQSKVTRLEKEVTEIAEQTLYEEETKYTVKIKSLESTIEQFSTLQEEYKSLLKIHHAANHTISDLESELLQLENNSSNQISISTQTDYVSDMSFESAVFTESSDNDSPIHKPKLNKTEDRTSFKDVSFQPKHSISTTSKLTSNDSTSIERKSFILSKPKSIGLPSSRYSINSDDSTKDLEDKVRQLQGDNSTLRDEINKKEKVIQNYQDEMKNAARNLKDIYTLNEPSKGVKITRRSKTGDITELDRNSGEILPQRCNGNHRDFESKIQYLQTEVQLFRDKISSLEQSNKELNDRLKNNSNTSTKKSVSPEGDRFKSNFLKSKIKFFESGPTEKKADTMLDKPEDVLRQQILDMEVLRQQVTDLENDRGKLHDNARRDKQIIHNQHIQINELQLSEKMLKEQVNSLSRSERELYEKCSILEDQVAKQEDEIHELQVLEKRLRELVRKLKLDEESWMTKSDNMVSNMEDLTNSEAVLKSKFSDLEKENSKLSDKTQYFELRIKELESSEINLIQKVKHYENMESILETKLKELQNSQDAANSQATELDIVSTDLEKNLAHALEENNMLARHVTELRVQMQEIDRQLLKSKDSEVGLKQHVDSLEKSEIVLQKRIKEFELRDIDAHAFNRELQQSMSILKDRNGALQRSENKMKYRILEIEAGDGQGSTNRKQGKLPERVEDCHQRILQLQNIVADLQRSVDENGNHNNRDIQDRELWEETERQMEELEKLNHQLNSLVEEERNGKEISGREVDIAKLNRKLESYQDFLYRLKQNLLTTRGPSSEHPDAGVIQDSNEVRRQNLQSKETKRVVQTVSGLTTYTEELTTVQGDHIGSLDNSRKRQSDDKILKRSDVQAHEEQLKRDTSGVFKSPLMKSVSQEVKQRLVHNNVGIIESSNSVSSKPEGRWTNSKSAKPAHADNNDVSIGWESVAKATSLSHSHQGKGEEELIIGLTLPSESECQSTYDTDSAMSSPEVPCAHKTASNNGSNESLAPPLPKTLPPTLPVKTVFVQDSYYLPSFNGGRRSNEELDNNNLVSPHRGKDKVTPFRDLSAAPIDDSVFVSKCDVQLTEKQAPIRNVSSLDSITDSGRGTGTSNVGHIQNLVDKIGYIEKQLQVTNEETETEEESLFEWKVKASERGQQLEISSSENRQLKNEINRLEKELEDRNRYISTLDQWLHSFDDIFKNKDIKSDRDIIQQLQSDLVKIKGELTNSGQRKEDISQDPAALQTELRIKNRELSSKRQEVETLLSEIRCWQDECHTIETMRSNALDSLRALEVEAVELQDVHSDLGELRNEYNSLRGQMDKVKDLTEETVILNNKVKDLENEQVSFQSIKEEYDNLRARFDEIESTKQKALTDVAPLKAKVARLSQKCEEKNSLIRRLVNELQSKGNKSILLDELRRLEVAMTDVESDVEGPILISPSRSQSHMTPHLQPSRMQGQTSPGYWSSSSSLSDCRDLLSDTELISAPENKLPQRPRSAEHASRPSHHRRRHLPTKPDFQSPKTSSLTSTSHAEPQLFLALSNYNPQFFSKSDKPWLEIPLKEGDRVKVIGPLNQSGYYEAEVNNRVGLVPASYLQPLHHSPDWYHTAIQERRIQNLQSTPRNQEGSPEKIINMFQQLNRPQPSPITASGSGIHFKPISGTHQTTQTKGDGQSTSTTQTVFNIPTLKSPPGAPDPPGNLKVQKIVGSTSLMLSWSLPTLNELNHSNSSQVTGYRIFCNGQICHQSHSPLLAKAVIENVPVAKQQKFSIQTMSANGLFSTSVSIMFNGTSTPSSGSDSDHDSDTDLSSILSKVHQGQGPRRQFIGVYDYNPQHNSPQNVTGQELSFQTGDEITVFGHQRPDGFYHAELNGKKGLVPARFIEELPSSSSNNSKSNKATYSSPVTTRFGSTENLNNFLSPSQTHL